MSKDWVGNTKSVYVTLASNSHSDAIREENDFYATDPNALKIFLDRIKKDDLILHENIWECSCGQGNLSEVLVERGYSVLSTDLIDRGYKYGKGGVDFLKENRNWHGDILTNPPYKIAKEFVEHSLSLLDDEMYCIMFLKIQFLEGKDRKNFFDKFPPKYIYVNSQRQKCAKDNDFSVVNSSAVCYCWFVWEKNWCGEPIVRWI